MILREILVILDRDEFSIEYAYKFFSSSRHLLNFIERECLKKIKFKIDAFNAIAFELSSKQTAIKKEPYINTEHVLVVCNYFEKEVYDNLSGKALSVYFFHLLTRLLDELNTSEQLPVAELKQSIDNFQKQDYINQWVHKKKLHSSLNLYFYLECTMTVEAFYLHLIIKRKEKILSRKMLLKTDPDEIAYHYQFKDIIFRDDTLIISSKNTENLLEIPIKKLLVHSK